MATRMGEKKDRKKKEKIIKLYTHTKRTFKSRWAKEKRIKMRRRIEGRLRIRSTFPEAIRQLWWWQTIKIHCSGESSEEMYKCEVMQTTAATGISGRRFERSRNVSWSLGKLES